MHDYHLLNEDSIISILGICFNADLFPLVIVHVKSIFNFFLALFEKSDLIIAACIHRCNWSSVQQVIVVYKLHRNILIFFE